MANITSTDLNSDELISALKSIEVPSVSVLELEQLKGENERLREELLNRHRLRLQELQSNENQRLSLIKSLIKSEDKERENHRLRCAIINTSQILDEASDVIFKLSAGFSAGDSVQISLERLMRLNKLISKGSRQLTFQNSLDDDGNCLPFSQVVLNEEIAFENKLDDIANFDFGILTETNKI